jgi:lipopolysaccharide/colanic/teichoic acid biosynthesis glycosyltransferase
MASVNLGPFNTPIAGDQAVGATLQSYARVDTATPEQIPSTTNEVWVYGARVSQALARLRANGWQDVQDLHRVSLLQRTMEAVFAATLLVLTAPVIVLLCLIVRLDSPGPVLFRQWRVGKGGRLFRFTKLRTLYVDAKERWPELYAYDYTPVQLDSLRFKVPNDPRVTRVGSWLRKSTLDELPNLWHVLTGDMALVGPRPEIPEMLPYYTDETMRKFAVRPGVTGLAQVSGRGHLTFHDTVDCDVNYVDTHGFWLDVRILVMTLVRSLQRHGAF